MFEEDAPPPPNIDVDMTDHHGHSGGNVSPPPNIEVDMTDHHENSGEDIRQDASPTRDSDQQKRDMIIRRTYRERSSMRSPGRQRARSVSPVREDPDQPISHANAQELVTLEHNHALTIVHESTSVLLEALFNPEPPENMIEELLASARHKYSYHLSPSGVYCEVFLVLQVAGRTNADIEGLSFLASKSEAGSRQVETLLNCINTWWAKAKCEPGPLIVSEKGKLTTNTAALVYAACKQQGTCFVGTRDDVDKIIQIVMSGGFDL
jgi:hypothetical protein